MAKIAAAPGALDISEANMTECVSSFPLLHDYPDLLSQEMIIITESNQSVATYFQRKKLLKRFTKLSSKNTVHFRQSMMMSFLKRMTLRHNSGNSVAKLTPDEMRKPMSCCVPRWIVFD